MKNAQGLSQTYVGGGGAGLGVGHSAGRGNRRVTAMDIALVHIMINIKHG